MDKLKALLIGTAEVVRSYPIHCGLLFAIGFVLGAWVL